jgi:hypothetical protein
VFLTSCDQIHVQCKLVSAFTPDMLRLFPGFASNDSFWVSHFMQGCVPGVGVVAASPSSPCTGEVSCPLCGNQVYSSLANPLTATVSDLKCSMSMHITRECTALPCSVDGCRYFTALECSIAFLSLLANVSRLMCLLQMEGGLLSLAASCCNITHIHLLARSIQPLTLFIS